MSCLFDVSSSSNSNSKNPNKGSLDTVSTKMVDEVLKLKEKLELLESELDQKYSELTERIFDKQKADARAGFFFKTYIASGSNGKVLNCTTQNKFSVCQDPISLSKLEAIIGKERFARWITKKRVIKVREDLSEEKLNKLAEAITSAGLSLQEYFDIKITYVATEVVSQEQYTLDDEKLKQFKMLVSQARPMFRSSTVKD